MNPLAALLREVGAYLIGGAHFPEGPARNGAGDPGCEAAFELLDQYVEAIQCGGGSAPRYAGVTTHLRNCDACAEDAEGLLAALTTLRE